METKTVKRYEELWKKIKGLIRSINSDELI